MRIVLDTNVLISSLIKEGKPRQVLTEVLRKHELVASREIMEELAAVSNEPKIRKYVEQQDITDFLRDLAMSCQIVRIRSKFKVVREDPDDDAILRTAYDGKASYIATGDRHLLDMKSFRQVKIIAIDEMLEILKGR
ncbi:MAG: putative toxin-antitoxin system toxin component, PIN family [Nitrososphaera sp.]